MRKAYEIIKELFYETNGSNPLQMTTRTELIEQVINLEKQNNSLFLSNEELKNSLKIIKDMTISFNLSKDESTNLRHETTFTKN